MNAHRLPILLAAATAIAVGLSWGEETRSFARYQVILDRSPFGPVPGSAQNVAPPGFATRFALVGIVQSNGENGAVQAIIEDKDGHRTYFKTESELIDDVKVLHIDVHLPQSVMIQHGLETATLTFSERAAGGAAPGSPQPMPGQPGQPAPPEAGSQQPPMVRRIPFRR